MIAGTHNNFVRSAVYIAKERNYPLTKHVDFHDPPWNFFKHA